jgi:ribosomal protein L11 methyltransferase
MSYPRYTFELRIAVNPSQPDFKRVKNRILEWLPSHGIDEFVEGVMDGLDIDHEFTGANDRDFYHELGGEMLPVSVFKYHRDLLEDLKSGLDRDFGDKIKTQIIAIETSVWLEGWKESFKPIESDLFYIHPPWDKSSAPAQKAKIVIEPGMAFGTGQHATTQVCLQRLEQLKSKYQLQNLRCIDVGTGTGILAIAAKKMGFTSVYGTDIDPDAVTSAKANAELNQLQIPFWQASAPKSVSDVPETNFLGPYDVVVANILLVVLEKIIGDLAMITKRQGMLILSGVLSEDGEHMARLAAEHGMVLLDRFDKEGWVCLTFIKQ